MGDTSHGWSFLSLERDLFGSCSAQSQSIFSPRPEAVLCLAPPLSWQDPQASPSQAVTGESLFQGA